jgi:hypothetical protein
VPSFQNSSKVFFLLHISDSQDRKKT